MEGKMIDELTLWEVHQKELDEDYKRRAKEFETKLEEERKRNEGLVVGSQISILGRPRRYEATFESFMNWKLEKRKEGMEI
jgi:hypothetical protein